MKPIQHISKALISMAIILVTSIPVYSQTWTQLTWSANTPTGIYYPNGVYDTTNNLMIVCGGENPFVSDTISFSNIWVFNHANGLGGVLVCTKFTTTGSTPTMRLENTAVYDNVNNRMIIFGGLYSNMSNSKYLDDVWVLNFANGLGGTPSWTQITTTGGPPARDRHTAVYDTTNNRMIIYGGYDALTELGDTWVLNHANGLGGTPTWTQLSPTGILPPTRQGHGAVYDNINNRMIIFGGSNYDRGATTFNDVWVFNHANGLGGTPTWTQITPGGYTPSPRFDQIAVYNPIHNRMIIFGGGGIPNASDSNYVWVLSYANGLGGTPFWTPYVPSGSLPPVGSSSASAYDVVNNRLTIFGGYEFNNGLTDMWVLSNADTNTFPTSVPNDIWELLE